MPIVLMPIMSIIYIPHDRRRKHMLGGGLQMPTIGYTGMAIFGHNFEVGII